MQISLFSFLSALGWSSLLIAGLYLLRRTRFRQYFGVLTMVLLYLFCGARLLLPLEFPHTLILNDRVIYPRVYDLLARAYDPVAHLPVSLLLCVLWLTGTLVLLGRYTVQYRIAVRAAARYARVWDGRTEAALARIRQQTGRTLRIHGRFAANVDSAFGMGIVQRYIILPDRAYSDEELHYILLHEYTHFLNHDTTIKLLVSLFCIIFWWNPVVYLLRRDLEQTLELKCDLAAARMLKPHERTVYLRAILSAIRQSTHEEQPMPQASTALFRPGAEDALRERFAAVTAYPAQPHRRMAGAVLVGACAMLLVCSYAVLPQPAYDPPAEKGDGVIDFDADSAFIRQDADGQYWLCIDGEAPMRINEVSAQFYLQNPSFRVVREDTP